MSGRTTICLALAALFAGAGVTIAQHESHAAAGLSVPASIHQEHEQILAALAAAAKAPGEVGAAGVALNKVLQPHFEREEQIALPPLGLLAPLARGEKPTATDEAVKMTDTLRREMPRMLEEHKTIRAAVERLTKAAQAAKASEQEAFAKALVRHAAMEEEILYPAAVLVGDLLKLRTAAR